MSTWVPSGQSPAEREPRRVSDSLDRITRRLGGPSAGTATTVFSRWADLVGTDIAAHARPVSLRDGVLVLAVDHPAWATQLRYMTSDLLVRIEGVAGKDAVSQIQVRVSGGPVPESPFRRSRSKGS